MDNATKTRGVSNPFVGLKGPQSRMQSFPRQAKPHGFVCRTKEVSNIAKLAGRLDLEREYVGRNSDWETTVDPGPWWARDRHGTSRHSQVFLLGNAVPPALLRSLRFNV